MGRADEGFDLDVLLNSSNTSDHYPASDLDDFNLDSILELSPTVKASQPKKTKEGPSLFIPKVSSVKDLDLSCLFESKTKRARANKGFASWKQHDKNKKAKDLKSSLDKLSTTFDSMEFLEAERAFNAAGVDDRDFKSYPNFITYAEDFAKNDATLRAKQIEIASHYYADICWNPKCTDIKFAEYFPPSATIDQIYEKVTFLEHGKCPKCGQRRTDFWLQGRKRPLELAGLTGQRGGKTFLLAVMSSYTLYQYLMLRQPQRFYGQPSSQLFEIMFVSITAEQVIKNLYKPFAHILQTHETWAAYHAFLDEEGRKLGVRLYNIQQTQSAHYFRGLVVNTSGPDTRTTRGATRIGVVFDELGWLIQSGSGRRSSGQDTVKVNAKGVFDALNTSMLTVRNEWLNKMDAGDVSAPVPLFASVSSPSSYNDMICQRVRESAINQDIVGFHYDSFEMNPTLRRDAFKTMSPEDYQRNVLAKPPKASSPFFGEATMGFLMKNLSKRSNIFIPTFDKAMVTKTKAFVKDVEVKVGKHAKAVNRVISIDAGEKEDSFAVSVGYVDDYGSTVIDGILEVIPEPNVPVAFAEIVATILQEFLSSEILNIKVLVADRWNSAYLVQASQMKDMIATRYSVSYSDFQAFRERIALGMIRLPKPEIPYKEGSTQLLDKATDLSLENYPLAFEKKPVLHALMQFSTVEDLLGKKVDKGIGFTDDIVRSIVLLDWALNNPDFYDALHEQVQEVVKQKAYVGVSSYSSSNTSGLARTSSGTMVIASAVSSGSYRGSKGIAVAGSSRR